MDEETRFPVNHWSGRQGVADGPARMADLAERLFGLTPAGRKQLVERLMIGAEGWVASTGDFADVRSILTPKTEFHIGIRRTNTRHR